jgi:chromosome segregation ATPase
LVAQAHGADAKVAQLHDQHAGLLRALEVKEREKEVLLGKIHDANNFTQAVKDDLHDTRTNYDQQIKILSEHILEMQDKVGKFESALSDMKSHKILCSKCKAWNTLEWLITEGRQGQRCIKGNHPVPTFMV